MSKWLGVLVIASFTALALADDDPYPFYNSLYDNWNTPQQRQIPVTGGGGGGFAVRPSPTGTAALVGGVTVSLTFEGF